MGKKRLRLLIGGAWLYATINSLPNLYWWTVVLVPPGADRGNQYPQCINKLHLYFTYVRFSHPSKGVGCGESGEGDWR